MNRVSRIATSLPDRSVLESIRQTDALLDRYRRMEEMHSRIATSLPDRSVLESIRQTDALLDRYRRPWKHVKSYRKGGRSLGAGVYTSNGRAS